MSRRDHDREKLHPDDVDPELYAPGPTPGKLPATARLAPAPGSTATPLDANAAWASIPASSGQLLPAAAEIAAWAETAYAGFDGDLDRVAGAPSSPPAAPSTGSPSAELPIDTPAPTGQPSEPLAGIAPRPVQAKRTPEAPSLQLRGEQSSSTAQSSVTRIAQQGIAGAGGEMPFQAQIQKAFGRHDVGMVTAHVDGKAAEATAQLGARAYAMGTQVVFGSAPDLHTAAHEAAHVVQQRSGAVPAGMGTEGDAFERHADRVADAVMAGDSAEELLDEYGGTGSGAGEPQFYGAECGRQPSMPFPPGNVPEYPAYRGTLDPWKGLRGECDFPPLEVTRGMDWFFDTGPESNLDTLDGHIGSMMETQATLSTALNDALAKDKESGVKDETGVRGALVEFQDQVQTMREAMRERDAAIIDVEGLVDEHDGLKDELATGKELEDNKKMTADEEAKAQAEVDETYAAIEEISGAAIDVLATAAKAYGNPVNMKDVAIDCVASFVKTMTKAGIGSMKESELGAKRATIAAKYGPIKAKLTRKNAAAVKRKLGGMRAQIQAARQRVIDGGTKYDEHLKLAMQAMNVIMTSESPITAFAVIQNYLQTMSPLGDKAMSMIATLRADLEWGYEAWKLATHEACDYQYARMLSAFRKYQNEWGPDETAWYEVNEWNRQIKVLPDFADRAGHFITSNQMWLHVLQVALTQLEHLQPAMDAMAAVAMLGGAKPAVKSGG